MVWRGYGEPVRLRGSTGLLIGGLAATGVVAAHLIAYLVAVPDPHHRAAVLESTGHGNWSLISSLALGALVAGLLRFVVRSFGSDEGSGGLSQGQIALRLASLQVFGFIALEMVERVGSGHLSFGLVVEPAILIGTILQIAIACLGAFLLILFTRVIHGILSRRRALPRDRDASRPFALFDFIAPRLALGTGGRTLRGPPSLLRS